MAGWPLPSPPLCCRAGHGCRSRAPRQMALKEHQFCISALQEAGSEMIWFSPPLLLALPRDPFFRSSGDAGCALSHLEK